MSLQLSSQSEWHCLVQMCGRIPRERDSLHRQVKKEFSCRETRQAELWRDLCSCRMNGQLLPAIDGELDVTGLLILPVGQETTV